MYSAHNQDSGPSVQRSPLGGSGHGGMMVAAFVASILVFIVAWFSHTKIENSAYEETGQALNTVQKSIYQSLHRWHEERTDDVLTWGKSSQVRRLTEELLKTKKLPEFLKLSPALVEMRDHLRPVLENGKYLGFFIISLDGINLASARDANVGAQTLIESAFFKKILADGAAVSHPQVSDVALPGISGKLAEGEATMFVGAPIKDGNGAIRAYLTLRIDSLRDFGEILKGGRIGKTGETYAFDSHGRLISASRFRERLIEYGLVSKEKTELLNVEIRDPGGELATGHRPVAFKQQPLTEMARRALGGKSGTTLTGYRNYLGDVVIGSWTWEPELDIGIATEISVGEAFKFLVTTRQYVMFTVIFSVFLLIGLTVVFLLGRKRIAQSEENLRTVVDSAPDGFIMIDEIGTIERFNLAAEHIFGYRSQEVISKNIKMLMPEPYHSQHDGYLAKFLTTGEKKIIGKGREVEGLRKDGTVFPLDLIVSEARVGASRKFVGITRDITERKRVERMKSEFVSTVSHELRTPLTSIRGSLGLISGGAVGEIQPKVQGMVSLALKNTERLIGLVNDILDMEKIESGKMEFSFDPVNLADLAKQAIENDRAYADELGVSLVITKEIEDGYVIGDSDRLSQVMANLISNASKFSHKGGEVEVAIERINNQIRVSVTDKGLGIPPGFRDKIFHRFSQADATDTRRTGGTGLGLNISKAIIKRHGGRIDFESRVGHGSTFYFEIQEKSQNDRTQIESETTIAASRGRFLVCEDDPDVASLISMILIEKGYDVDVVYNAKQAKSKLAEKSYDAMTVDIILPDMDGFSLIKDIRDQEETQKLPIIIVSIKSGKEGLKTLSSITGIIDWIEKPIKRDRLQEAAEWAMNASHQKLPRILYVEDDLDLTKVISAIIAGTAHLDLAMSLGAAKKSLSENPYDLVIIDVALPDGSGLELLQDLSLKPDTRTIIFAADEVGLAVKRKVDAVFIKSRTPNEMLVKKIRQLISSKEENNIEMETIA